MLQLAGKEQCFALFDQQNGDTAVVLGAVARRAGEAERSFVERQDPLGPSRRKFPVDGGGFGVDRTGLFKVIGDHGAERIVDHEPLLERGSGTKVQRGSTHRIDAIEDDVANEVVTEPVPVRGMGEQARRLPLPRDRRPPRSSPHA